MSSKTLVPVIAGCAVGKWGTRFQNHVTLWSEEGRPLEGSMGINFDAMEDLSLLFSRLDGRRETMLQHLLATVVTHPREAGLKGDPKPLTEAQGNMLLDYYFWAQGDEPYFILRKGKQCLGLYRKTSKYFFKNKALTLPHRIEFQFVRELTTDEVPPMKGQVIRTLLWQEVNLPKPVVKQSLEDTMARLSRTRQAIFTLVGDLDAALARFHSSLV
jgi:hypothetical protein